MAKPFISLVCDRKSWAALLHAIPVRQRFSSPDRYDQELVDSHGRPLYVETEGFECHIYPPGTKE